MQMFQYKIVGVGEGAFGLKRDIRADYQAVVDEYTRQGWRLVQVFAPSTGGTYGRALFCDVIFERPVTGEE